MVASRWLDDAWWPNIVDGFFGFLPPILRPLVSAMARRQVRRTYVLHGLGKHSLEEQKGFARRDLAALNAATANASFLLGEAPNVFDYTLASLMAGIYDNQPATWLTGIAREYPELQAYTERVQQSVGVFGRALAPASPG